MSSCMHRSGSSFVVVVAAAVFGRIIVPMHAVSFQRPTFVVGHKDQRNSHVGG